jgi:hypothetical protein
MTDDSGEGAVPVHDATVSAPPTVDEVLKGQAENFPEQARPGMHYQPATDDELAAVERGGDPVDDRDNEGRPYG